jgi:hypothetical protein
MGFRAELKQDRVVGRITLDEEPSPWVQGEGVKVLVCEIA